MDWSELGKNIFGGVHTAGKVLASAFGAGKLAEQAEQLESPILPDWAKGGAKAKAVVVTAPDYIVFLRKDAPHADTMKDVLQVVVSGGKRIEGTGYRPGEKPGKTFSFGYEVPAQVGIVVKGGAKTILDNVIKILFLGGVEGGEQVIGGYDWRAIFYDPAGELYRTLNPSRDYAPFVPMQSQTGYWGAQRGQAGFAQQRLTASQQQLEALRAIQAARAQSLREQAKFLLNDRGYEVTQGDIMDKDVAQILGEDDFNEDVPGDFIVGDDDLEVAIEDDYTHGIDVIIGATAPTALVSRVGKTTVVPKSVLKSLPQSAGFVKKSTPKGRQFLSLQLNRDAKNTPKRTLAAVRAVAKRAEQLGKKMFVAAKKVGVKPSAKSSVVGAAKRLGSVALQAMAAKVIESGKKLHQTADSYAKTIKAMEAKKKAGMAKAQTVTKIHGLASLNHVIGDTEISGWDEAADKQFVNASLELVGDIDWGPAYGTPEWEAFVAAQNNEGSTAAPSTPVSSNLPGPPDYGAGQPPTLESVVPQPYVDYQPDPTGGAPDTTFYDCPTDGDLPLGAIIFDGSRTPPFRALGSYTAMVGKSTTDYDFAVAPGEGVLPGAAPPKGGPGSGFELHLDGWWLLLQGTQPSVNYSGNRNFDKVANPDSAMVFESKKNNWGPLVGHPSLPEWRGLRFSPSGPNGPRWFWFFDTAPDWAKRLILEARLNDAIVAYKAAVVAGQTDFVNAQIQDQLDAAEAKKLSSEQSKQDAKLAMQQKEQDAQQAAFEQAQANRQMELEAQRQQLETQAAFKWEEAQAQVFAQHPEMFTDGAEADYDEADGAQFEGEVTEDQVDWGE